jgi:uncharacterized protein YjbJ (UPF0337 family)
MIRADWPFLGMISAGRRKNPDRQTTNFMNTIEFKGDWKIIKGKLKQRWAKLTDKDLKYAEGKAEELFGRIQKRTGETLETVQKAVHEFCASDAPAAKKPADKK